MAVFRDQTLQAGQAVLASQYNHLVNNIGISNLYANAIINGDMIFSQRGDFTSAAAGSTSTYYIDRWKLFLNGVTANHQLITSSQPSGVSGTQSYKVIATSSSSNAQMGFLQEIEDGVLDYFQVQTYSFGAWVKSNNSAQIVILGGGLAERGGSTIHTGDGTWQFLHGSVTNTQGAETFLRCYIMITGNLAQSSIPITTNDYVEATAVRLNIGAYVMPHAPRNYETEFSFCQRYYEKSYNIATAPATDTSTGLFQAGTAVDANGNAFVTVDFQEAKRTTPTMTFYEKGGSSGWLYDDNGGGYANFAPNTTLGEKGLILWKSGETAGQVGTMQGHWVADAEI